MEKTEIITRIKWKLKDGPIRWIRDGKYGFLVKSETDVKPLGWDALNASHPKTIRLQDLSQQDLVAILEDGECQYSIDHWSNLVANVFQSIGGSNKKRVDQIYKWLVSFLDLEIPVEDPDMDNVYRQIEEFCKPYFVSE